jgi:hypothetical protein
MRLGRRGLAFLRDNRTLDDERLLLFVTGHMRAFGQEGFQRRVKASWAALGWGDAPIALHTWDAIVSAPSWWWAADPLLTATHTQPPLLSAEHTVRNSSFREQLLVYEVQDPKSAGIRAAVPLLAGRHCLNGADLDAMYGMYASLHAQSYALMRVPLTTD